MNIRFFGILVVIFFGISGLFLPVLAHDGAPLDADGCHECRSEDGCFFFDYWSVPRVTRHCHAAPKAVAATTSASVSVEAEKPASRGRFARVLRVPTGDEIEVEFEDDRSRALVQLLGVQSPASSGPAYSPLCAEKIEESSRAYLEDFVLDKKVEIRPSLVGEDALPNGTLLRSVFRGKTFVNEKLLKEGYGMADESNVFEFLSDFSNDETLARRDEKGVWNPEFCKEKERSALLGMLANQISRYQSFPAILQYAFAGLGLLGVYLFSRLIRRSRVVA
ncbi:MAG: thermonuclease family protein [Nanoarchaeota archaeon]|nr:thermonuclease family protein [Nanoarchaeota archaeon]